MSISFSIFFTLLFLISSCANYRTPYETPSSPVKQEYKEISLPFKTGTKFKVSQGAFGKKSHSEPGNEYSWDFDVPYGTSVLAIEAGRVIGVWEPNLGGVCNESFKANAHNIKIEHSDGTVAQYVHIKSRVQVGDLIKKRQVIATTSQNGFICQPHLHLGVYQSRKHLYHSPGRKTLPLFFRGLPEGQARDGATYEVR